MVYLWAFLVCGFICLIGQLILDNTKLTPGHVTSILVVVGAILSFFGMYESIIKCAGMGANLPITSFGNLLYQGAYQGYLENGVLGIFTGMLTMCSAGISSTVIISFILTLFFEAKD